MDRLFESEHDVAAEGHEEPIENKSSSAAREAQQAAGNAAVAREVATDTSGAGHHATGLALGRAVRGSLSTGGMLGSLAGGSNLVDVHKFTAPHAGRYRATLSSDFGSDFGCKLVVRDAQTQQVLASHSGYNDSFSVSFAAEENAQLEIELKPMRTSAWMRNSDSRNSNDQYKWFYIGDSRAGSRYSLVVKPVPA